MRKQLFFISLVVACFLVTFTSCKSEPYNPGPKTTVIPLNSSFDDALTKALENSEVQVIDLTLSKDSEVTKHYDINKPLTVRLNGFRLTQAEGLKARPFKVIKDDIQIEFDGTKKGSSFFVSPEDAVKENQNYGIIDIAANNVSIFLNGGSYIGNTDDGAFIIINKNINEPTVSNDTASITIKNAIVNTNSRIIYTNETLDTENVVIENCKIKQVNENPKKRTTVFTLDNMAIDKINATFNNVDIETDGALPVEASGFWTSFNNCNFKVTTDQAIETWTPNAITASYDGITDVNSGSFYSEKYGAYIYSTGGKINIKDGVTIESPYAAIYASNMNKAEFNAVINISGGKIIGPIKNDCTGINSKIIITGGTFEGTLESKNKDNLVIKGGSFNSDPSEFVPTGFKVTKASEKNWIVSQDK